ncbi:unnamed protein product, partial [marine sediment metagenome]
MDLIQQLIRKKILDKKQGVQLKTEIKESGKTQEEVILEKNIVAEPDLFELKSKVLGIPLKETLPEEIPQDVLSVIPRESVEFYKIIPLSVKKEEGILEVGMVCPENAQAKEALKFLARQQKLKPEIFLITLSDFKNYLSKYRAPKREMEKALERLEEEIKVGRGEKEKVVERV